MAEPTYREIQLSKKQLVFSFMSAVVVLTAVFLLGVSVGRGVGGPAALSADTGAPSDTLVSTEAPPTEVGEGELTYHDDLQGRGAAGAPQLPPAPPPQVADPVTPDPEPEPVAAQPPPPPAQPAPAIRTPPASQTSSPPPAAAGEWAVQLGAFGVRANADGLVAELKAKGFAAYIDRPSSNSSLFAVRVGPFQTRAQAEGMQQRLLQDPKGYKSSIVR